MYKNLCTEYRTYAINNNRNAIMSVANRNVIPSVALLYNKNLPRLQPFFIESIVLPKANSETISYIKNLPESFIS